MQALCIYSERSATAIRKHNTVGTRRVHKNERKMCSLLLYLRCNLFIICWLFATNESFVLGCEYFVRIEIRKKAAAAKQQRQQHEKKIDNVKY